ncbi:MAG TPA: ATP-binding protein, partial [Magnetospirillum sp.]|nr:ATP-binding protein [Magnetospirillum sp.]
MSVPASDFSWTGEFTDAAREQTFAATLAPRTLGVARLCIIATTMTSVGFAPMDVLTVGADRLPWFLGDRLLIALVCVATLALLRHGGDIRRVTFITYAQQYAFFTLNALIFDHPVLLRHGGVLLPLIAISLLILLPGSFRAAATISAFAPGISLIFWGVARPQPETPQDLLIIVLLTLVAYVVGAVARTQFNRMRREEYLLVERERRTNQDLLEAKEAAEAGSRAKADFLAVMSHEIRTPVSGVLGMVRLVLDSDLSDGDRRRLETACQSAEGLLTILDDILDISKLESGRVEFEKKPFPLGRTIEGVATLMAARAREKGIGLTLDLDSGLPEWVSGDSARLRQILFNLAGNAVKFTEAGSVTLRAQATGIAPDNTVRVDIVVTDTGIGMDDAQQARIFQTFGQADASINRRFGGTGLGLVICKKLVEGMGGTIGFDSTPGAGSRFYVSLTFTPADPVAESPSEPAQAIEPLSILLAEDNAINREVAQAYLNKSGHAVTTAVDGAEAVRLAAQGGFDLILMDLRMPEVDGLEATRRIRALPAPLGQVPIVALTANAMRADIDACHAVGMDAHVAKPITEAALNRAIRRVLAHGRHGDKPGTLSFDILLMGEGAADVDRHLKSLGHRVFVSTRDDAALAMLAARPFDMVVAATADPARVAPIA